MRERFNTVAVAIPAQLFNVRCHVSIDRQVPVMTDFAVRLLHLSGPLEVSALREYFGLTPSGLQDLLALLREEGLVGEANGRIALTSYAEARFTASSDGLPRFTRITERQSRPVFELLTFTPLPKALSNTYWDNSLQLKWAAGEDDGNTIERAEAAFHQHFLDIDQLEHEGDRRRAYSCYKVDDIRAGRPFNVPMPVHFEVDVEGNVDFEIDAQLDLLPESLRSQVRTLTADRIGAFSPRPDYLRSFVEYFEDELLTRYLHEPTAGSEAGTVVKVGSRLTLRKEPVFDFGRYVHDVHGNADGAAYDGGHSRALLGALYMPKSETRLLESLRRALSQIKRAGGNASALPPAVLWVIPESELWGRTELVRRLLEALRLAFKETIGASSIAIVCVAPCRQDEPNDSLFKRGRLLMDAGFSAVTFGPYMPKYESYEALLVPGVFGAAMYLWSVPSAEKHCVPLGFVTQSPDKLRQVAVLAKTALSSALHMMRRGAAETGDERRLKLEQADLSEFTFLDAHTVR